MMTGAEVMRAFQGCLVLCAKLGRCEVPPTRWTVKSALADDGLPGFSMRAQVEVSTKPQALDPTVGGSGMVQEDRPDRLPLGWGLLRPECWRQNRTYHRVRSKSDS